MAGRRLALLFALGCASAACGSGSGADQDAAADSAVEPPDAAPADEGADGPRTICSVYLAEGACADCLEQQCCDPGSACEADAACWALALCLETCSPSDSACLDTCIADNLDGLRLFSATFSCIALSCADECGFGACGGYLSAPDATCQGCLDETCCDQQLACATDADCIALANCVYAVGGASMTCWELFHAAGGKYLAANACVSYDCGPACGAQTDQCGSFVWPDPACTTCMQEDPTCCGLAIQCTKSAECEQLSICMQWCPDEACKDECWNQASDHALALLRAANQCITMRCAKECDWPSAPCGDPLDSAPNSECYLCLQASCCAELSAFNLDPESLALEICRERCDGDATCEQDCAFKHPDGVAISNSLTSCYDTHCGATCE